MIDQGTVGRNNKWKLCKLLRAWFENDLPHRRHNNVNLSLNWNDLQWLKIEMGLTVSVAAAPYGKCMFFGELKEANEELRCIIRC